MTQNKADQDLDAQQQHLSSIQYDLRITNLARFIYKKLHACHPEPSRGILPRSASWRIGRDDNGQGGQRLIDIGAGNGLFLKFFKQKGFTVSGIELEQENVDNMKRDPQLAGDDIRQGDITHMKGKEQYDVVIASDVIEHIEDDVKAIRGLWSFLKPGGMLIITVPAHSFLYGKRDEKWGHFRRYDKHVLLERIEEAVSLQNTSPRLWRGTPLTRGEFKSPLQKRGVERSETGCFTIQFSTFWNFIGFFVYGLFEKILHKPINEEMRYSNSIPSRIVRGVLDSILKVEEAAGGTSIGLTLVVGVRKAGDTLPQ